MYLNRRLWLLHWGLDGDLIPWFILRRPRIISGIKDPEPISGEVWMHDVKPDKVMIPDGLSTACQNGDEWRLNPV